MKLKKITDYSGAQLQAACLCFDDKNKCIVNPPFPLMNLVNMEKEAANQYELLAINVSQPLVEEAAKVFAESEELPTAEELENISNRLEEFAAQEAEKKAQLDEDAGNPEALQLATARAEDAEAMSNSQTQEIVALSEEKEQAENDLAAEKEDHAKSIKMVEERGVEAAGLAVERDAALTHVEELEDEIAELKKALATANKQKEEVINQ